MHKIVVMYQTPSDPEQFKNYYENKHLPLARTMPGMLASRHSFDIGAPDGSAPYFCIWEGDFADAEAAGAAVQSEIGQRVAADTANYTDAPLALIMYTTTEG